MAKGDESAYLAAAETLLDPATRARIGAEARRTAETLGWPAVVAELEGIFRDVIASHHHPQS